jgi:hypothetical protein
MKLWPALLLAPLLALASISAGYALVPPACSPGRTWLLDLFILPCLAGAVACTLLAWKELRRSSHEPFLSLVATGAGAFFSLVIATQWVTRLVLDPCMH